MREGDKECRRIGESEDCRPESEDRILFMSTHS